MKKAFYTICCSLAAMIFVSCQNTREKIVGVWVDQGIENDNNFDIWVKNQHDMQANGTYENNFDMTMRLLNVPGRFKGREKGTWNYEDGTIVIKKSEYTMYTITSTSGNTPTHKHINETDTYKIIDINDDVMRLQRKGKGKDETAVVVWEKQKR